MKKRFLRIMSILLTVAMVSSLLVIFAVPVSAGAAAPDPWDGTIATGFAGGTGAEDAPYEIADASQLAYLAKLVNDQTSVAGACYVLTSDINLGNRSWTPIGNANSATQAFTGNFDGAGHTISGLNPSVSVQYTGLFGTVLGGTLSNFSVSGSAGSNKSNGAVGMACGFIRYRDDAELGVVTSAIVNVTVYGTVNGATNQYTNYAGGVVGSVSSGVAVRDCATLPGTVVMGRTVGGIAGIVATGGKTGDTAYVQNCINFASVTCDATKQGSDLLAGGIAGFVNLQSSGYMPIRIENCVNYGSVTGAEHFSGAGKMYVGGIVGNHQANADNKINNCTNYGNVSGTRTNEGTLKGLCVGGIAGNSSGGNTANGAMTNLYNYGNVSAVVPLSLLTDTYECYAGGLTGTLNSNITNAANYGDVSSVCSAGGLVGALVGTNGPTVRNAENRGAVNGGAFAGGFVGLSTTPNGIIAYSCASLGSVTAAGEVLSVAASSNLGLPEGNALITNAGGFAAFVNKAQFYNCISNCDVTVQEYAGATAYTSSTVEAGGICGVWSRNAQLRVESTLSCGNISGAANANVLVGATGAGGVAGSVLAVYYLSDDVINIDGIDWTNRQCAPVDTAKINGTNTTAGNWVYNGTHGKCLTVVEAMNNYTNTYAASNDNYRMWKQGAAAPELAGVTYATVTISDDLAYNFYLKVADIPTCSQTVSGNLVVEPVTVSLSYRYAYTDEPTELTPEEVTVGGDEYLKFTLGSVNAADIAKSPLFTLTYTQTLNRANVCTQHTFTYGAINYASNLYGKASSTAEFDAVLEAMMYYGDAAQSARGSLASALDVFAAMTAAKGTAYEIKENYVTAGYTALALNAAAGVTPGVITSAALTADGNVQVVIRVADPAAETATVTFLGETYEYAVTDGEFVTDCLYATSLNSVFTVTVGEATTEYSVSNYIVSGIEGEVLSAEQKTLARAMAVYMDLVSEYANSIYAE